jgi:L,D-transpeptidase ErfK/SrfK
MKKIKLILIGSILLWLSLGIPCYGENPWTIRINIPEFKLYLYQGQELYQTFNVAVGKLNTPSPLGDFSIVNKVLDPTWYPADGRAPVPAGNDNPLGKYWLGLNIEGYGIHGNSASWSIGTPASLGCFRLHNNDIQKLFQWVPVGTPVQIVYETVHTGIDSNNCAWIEVFPDIYKFDNLEAESTKALQGLGWAYEPHWKALAELLAAKKPLKTEVPRTIRVDGESLDIDGFYWQQEVYISQKSLDVLSLIPRATNTSSLFNGYVKLDINHFSKENPEYFWDNEKNTLRIIRLKVLLNGMELSNSARWGKEKRILIDLKMVATTLGVKFSWDFVSKAFICNGIMIAGEPREGGFWVAPEDLARIWQNLKCHWDQNSATLDLQIK